MDIFTDRRNVDSFESLVSALIVALCATIGIIGAIHRFEKILSSSGQIELAA
jgi:hypothetical protein